MCGTSFSIHGRRGGEGGLYGEGDASKPEKADRVFSRGRHADMEKKKQLLETDDGAERVTAGCTARIMISLRYG